MFISKHTLDQMRAENDAREVELRKNHDVKMKEIINTEIKRKSELRNIETENIKTRQNSI